jgi:hypothetical protein
VWTWTVTLAVQFLPLLVADPSRSPTWIVLGAATVMLTVTAALALVASRTR